MFVWASVFLLAVILLVMALVLVTVVVWRQWRGSWCGSDGW
jgi:hypothetical protein